jgi:hypothetical protein
MSRLELSTGSWKVSVPSQQSLASPALWLYMLIGSLGTPAGATAFTGGTWRKDAATTANSLAQPVEVKDSQETGSLALSVLQSN